MLCVTEPLIKLNHNENLSSLLFTQIELLYTVYKENLFKRSINQIKLKQFSFWYRAFERTEVPPITFRSSLVILLDASLMSFVGSTSEKPQCTT